MPRIKHKQIDRAIGAERLMWAHAMVRDAAREAPELGKIGNRRTLEKEAQEAQVKIDSYQVRLDAITENFSPEDTREFEVALDEARAYWPSRSN